VLKSSVDKHQIPAAEIDEDDYKYDTAWLECAQSLRQPVSFRFPRGAVYGSAIFSFQATYECLQTVT
jgi:hypothetical protein